MPNIIYQFLILFFFLIISDSKGKEGIIPSLVELMQEAKIAYLIASSTPQFLQRKAAKTPIKQSMAPTLSITSPTE